MGICNDAKLAANWVQDDLSAQLNRNNLDITSSPVNAEQLGGLLVRVKDDTINGKARGRFSSRYGTVKTQRQI